ncbi:hypothetical protein SH467x_001424 [Pirellulaceae bacterium SH467]|jgi:hypothetical protein
MNRLGSFGSGVLVGIVALYAAMHYTILHAQDGIHLIPKITAKLENPYQDIRGFKLAHWQSKQSLALAVVRANKGYLLSDPSLLTFRENAQSVLAKYRVATPKPMNQLVSSPTNSK